MSDALLAGVSGLQAHQTMLDVAGNNLANVNTYGFKSSRARFSELLAQTLREATQPTAGIGGTNPQQIGSGTKVASIDRNVAQGNLVYTGQALDMAIEGGGYFALSDGRRNVYTRVGAFAVDAANYLVDPDTGFRVQRTGSEGVAEGFQSASSNDIRIPYDIPLPPKATENITFTGNLDAGVIKPSTNILMSSLEYTVDGARATGETLLTDLDQATGVAAGETIHITGTDRAGTAVAADFTIAADSTLNDLVAAVTAAFSGSQARFGDGRLTLTDQAAGYSQTDVNLSYAGAGTLDVPNYFIVSQAGSEAFYSTNSKIIDSQGSSHESVITFVKTNQPNTWDAILASIDGDVTLSDRRVKGITFNNDGTYMGMGGAVPDDASFRLTYAYEPGNEREILLGLGTAGELDGLTQFGKSATASANGQDGYEAGYLASMSVGRDGVVTGIFTNGIRRDIAALQIATFQNPAGLQAVGNGFFTASANSGDPAPSRAGAAGAGAVTAQSLEKSNVDMASEFVNLIQAQNGYQANARTIRVTTDMLAQLATLIR